MPGAPAAAAPPVQQAAARISVETVVVDRQGTWIAGSDIADVFPGSTGVLKRSVTLQGRLEPRRRETVDLIARIAPSLLPDGGCSLRLETEVRRSLEEGPKGQRPSRPETRSVSLDLRQDEDRLVEIYASGLTDGRLAVKVRCGAAVPGDTAVAAERSFVEFLVSVARGEGEAEPVSLKRDALRALLGREASTLFSFNVPLEADEAGGKRYRRETMEVALSPVLISGDRVQVELRIGGELATVSASAATVTHPIERRQTLVMAPGQPHGVDIEVAGGVGEGWTRVRYRLEIGWRS